MSEPTKLRLVRCPKCENLLSEPEDSQFFQCGGCLTVLRAKTKEPEAEADTAKPVSVNSSSETSSDSDSVSLRHNKRSVPIAVKSNDNSSVLGGDRIDPKSLSGRHDSGLDRFKQRTTKRCDSDSVINRLSTFDEGGATSSSTTELDRAGLLRQLDKLKEELINSSNVATEKSKEQTHTSSGKAPPLRFHSSGNHHPPPSYYHDVPMYGRGGPPPPPPPPPHHPYFSGHYGHDLFDTYPQHHSSCGCHHCYGNKYWRGSVIPDAPYNAGFYPHEDIMGFVPPLRSYGTSRVLHPHGRWHSEAHIDAHSRIRHPKVVLSSGSSRHIRPLAGGAPFITCQNCFELLQLPKKPEDGSNKKVRCGACSSLMDLSVVDNKFVVSMSTARSVTRVAADYTSDDYDYVFDEPQHVHSHSASLSEDELSSDSLTAKPVDQDQDLNVSSINHDRFGVGSRSERSEQDKGMLSKAMRQNSMKDVASEMEVSFNEYSQVRSSKKIGFASIVKKSFKDLTKSRENESNVSINGQTLTERMVRKAEKQAGAIQPGNYWYDYRAGFWGVMGGPGLGILPPFIEEMNFPMPENCAGGTTGVFVNGRELNRKDLDLLAGRGLPTERDRSYIVDITGRVRDEDTNEELDCLGKLAPTIEKMKRGFGMRTPKRAI